MNNQQQQDPESFSHANTGVDDDGRPTRKGTFFTATAHIITAVIGSGVLSLAWATAQLGWIAGPLVLFAFSLITYFTSVFLADCYRGPTSAKRNYTYMNVVQSYLGGKKVQLCGAAQYANLLGTSIGYTITASISMVAVRRSNCFHRHGHQAMCKESNIPSMMIFAAIQIVLSQLPNFHNLALLSVIAAVMSFAYSGIGLGLSIAEVAAHGTARTTLSGTVIGLDLTRTDKFWNVFQAIGNIAFAFTFSNILVEIQDTLKSSPPENTVMKKASLAGIWTTSVFYILCGCMGYAAFGNDAPGNFLTGFGFYEPFWLIDIANICITVHLIGAYQVFTQPLFEFVERKCNQTWPENKFLTAGYSVNIPGYGSYNISLYRLVWRTAYVIATTVVAMILPFFNDFLGLIGAMSYFPLTVYFPIEVHIAQTNLSKKSPKWIFLKVLTIFCFLVSLVAAIGSVEGLVQSVRKFKPFQT